MNALDLIQSDLSTPDAPVRVVDRHTGEVFVLAQAPAVLIASVLGQIDQAIADHLGLLRDAKRVLGDELIARMDTEGEWTQRAPGVKVSAPSPSAGTTTWDAELLRSILDDLVTEKKITADAALRACKVKVEHVPVVAGIAKLEKIPGLSERLEPARRVNPPPERKVSVKTNPGEM